MVDHQKKNQYEIANYMLNLWDYRLSRLQIAIPKI